MQPRCSLGREPRPAVGVGAAALQRPRGAAPAVRIDSGPPAGGAAWLPECTGGDCEAPPPLCADPPRIEAAVHPVAPHPPRMPVAKLWGSTTRAHGGNPWLADQNSLAAANRIQTGNEAVGCVLFEHGHRRPGSWVGACWFSHRRDLPHALSDRRWGDWCGKRGCSCTHMGSRAMRSPGAGTPLRLGGGGSPRVPAQAGAPRGNNGHTAGHATAGRRRRRTSARRALAGVARRPAPSSAPAAAAYRVRGGG